MCTDILTLKLIIKKIRRLRFLKRLCQFLFISHVSSRIVFLLLEYIFVSTRDEGLLFSINLIETHKRNWIQTLWGLIYTKEIENSSELKQQGWNGQSTKSPYTFILPGARFDLILGHCLIRHDAGFCFVLQRHAKIHINARRI